MGQKIKFVLVGLIGVAAIFIFLFLQTLNTKQQVVKERDKLKSENTALSKRAEKLNNDLRDAQGRASALAAELEAVGRARDELQKKYEIANRTKDELLEKLQAQQGQPAQAQPMPGERSDEYWAQVLKQKTELQMQLDEVRAGLKAVQVKNEELLRDKSTAEMDLNNLKRQAEELQHQIEYNKKIMDNIAQELVWEKNEKLKIEESIKPFKKENAVLSRQLKGLNKQKMNLERRIQRVEQDKDSLEGKLSDMETMLVDKISQISNLKEELEAIRKEAQRSGRQPKGSAPEKKDSVELPPIVVRPQEAEAVIMGEPATVNIPTPEEAVADAPKFKGNILTVNRESNFVIIDLGEDAGIKVGNTFQVDRGSEPVGIIEVIKTSKSVAACDIKQENSPIKVGDVIR